MISRPFRPLPFLAALALLGCGPTALEAGGGSGVDQSEIVGGSVDTGDPAVVQLVVSSGGGVAPFCTGTLIARQTILTAAHCVYPYGTGYTYYALFGTYASNPTSFAQVASQFRNPSYTGGMGHDVGVFKLTNPVTNVVPIELNTTALTSADIGRPIRHVGFGATEGVNKTGGGVKRQVSYAVRQLSQLEIESGASGQQTCSGDSGGPGLMITAGSSAERVAGVISSGDGTCVQYGLDARVDAELTWIKNTYAAWEQPTCADDGKCLQGCTPVDQDCACASDGQCTLACNNILKDPDCPKECVQDNVCSLKACPTLDPDCQPVGGPCANEEVCPQRKCVGDPQHTRFYCSRSCSASAECPSGMECKSSVCLFQQRPVAELGEACNAETWCRSPSVCTGPTGGVLRCAKLCGSQTECPSGQTCEGGVDGQRYCRGADPTAPPKGGVKLLPAAPTQLAAIEGCAVGGGEAAGLFAVAVLLRRRRG
jgi:V8-like Glu-specific endopeptidase